MELEKRIFAFVLGVLLFSAFMALLTSCSPYDQLQPATPTATAPAIVDPVQIVSQGIPLPYWQLAAGDPWQVVSISTAEHSDLKGALK